MQPFHFNKRRVHLGESAHDNATGQTLEKEPGVHLPDAQSHIGSVVVGGQVLQKLRAERRQRVVTGLF